MKTAHPFAIPMVRLDKREARSAAHDLDELLLPLQPELDFDDCVLLGLRGRLRSREREVPAQLWPTLRAHLADAPGTFHALVPCMELDEDEVGEFVGALMWFHVSATLEGGVDASTFLASEGLLNAVLHGERRVAGTELVEFVNEMRDLAASFQAGETGVA